MKRQKYSYLFERDSEEPAPRGRRRVVWSPWSSSARSQGRPVVGRSGTSLSPGEKAGVLGMVVVVVVILGLVFTSGGSPEAAPLNPDSQASKIKRALDHQDQPVDVVKLNNTSLNLREDRRGTTGKIFKKDWQEQEKPNVPRPGASKPRTPDVKKSTATKSAYRTYVIKKGDVLSRIARRLLGKSSRWPEIKKLNPKLDERNLRPGIQINVPAR